jgi:hypothetical protein
MCPVDRGQHEEATRSEPSTDGPERRGRILEVLDRERRQRHIETGVGERVAVPAQVRDRELVEPRQRHGGRVDIDAHEPRDAGPERNELTEAAAARVEGRGVTVGECLVQEPRDHLVGGRPQPEPWQDPDTRRRPCGRRGRHQAVAVADSAIPWDSSHRSASMAALQPSPAAVTAWRYR